MTSPVTLPLWLFVLILLFAAVTFASHFLFPSVRWFFRRRAERVVKQLNQRLKRPIEPFKLLARQDTIQRLVYDPEVIKAVQDHARREGVREDVAFETAKRYAREIVPSFSASLYFGFAVWIARMFSRAFYRVHLSYEDEQALQAIPENATVVYVINHRSNMDYVLVTYLASDQSALAFAAGEWARVWPLGRLVKAMGAYFIRRRSRNDLYRRVLARYVNIATRAGMTQAVFPEGGLSLTGNVENPKLGLISYVMDAMDGGTDRDIVFVPVSVAYDRVMEDRVLVKAGQTGERRFRFRWRSAIRYLLRHVFQRLTGKFLKFGFAAVNFGCPISVRGEYQGAEGTELTEIVANEVTTRIRRNMPVLPVPVVAQVLLEATEPLAENDIVDRACTLIAGLDDSAKDQIIFAGGEHDELRFALSHIRSRHLLADQDNKYAVLEEQRALLTYYANTLPAHRDGSAA